ATETPATETPATETPATETPATETPATETPATGAGNDTSAVAKIEVDEKPAKPSLGENVNGVFASAVDHMASVLFYRFLSSSRAYVQIDHVEHYVRDRDSTDSFVKHDPNGDYEATELTEKEAEALLLRGKLISGTKELAYRPGSIGSREVDFVSIVMDQSTKYVAKDDTNKVFILSLGSRELVSEEESDMIALVEVDALAKQGRLKVDAKESHILSEKVGGAPIVVLWLGIGSVFFTLYMMGVNFWAFTHAIEIVRGKYDNPNEPGEVSHFQALSSALSATVGLGNIAGVTIAMTAGGPGAFFWMLMCGFFGMTSKFVECTLGQRYRRVKEDGTILGGPMQYLSEGLKELGLGPLGMVLSIVFAVMCILASFGGGNMFQANQSGSTMLAMLQSADIDQMGVLNTDIKATAASTEKGDAASFTKLEDLQKQKTELQGKMDAFKTMFLPVFGVFLATMVAVVIIGGIKRIGAAAEKVVPTMCLMYIAACMFIILSFVSEVPALFGSIFTEAFSPKAFGGGMIGVLVIGVQRAAFSNEAGVGSASIAHSAARTDEPVREGIVALLGPFIDTIVVCSMTAMVILITGAWNNEAYAEQGLQGAALTSAAFGAVIPWFPYVLAVAVVLFAYSTIISWSYYGERCWERLFGPNSTVVYKAIYVSCVFIGTVINLGAVLDFSDMMILSMAFPNVLGCFLLAPKVKADLADYWRRYQNGEFKTFN
ncbi:MAG: AGCS family alanine or glycine:cation symporter, partial [Pirellulaceae bacterium]